MLQLNMIKKFVILTADHLYPDVVPMVLPLLVAFVDLEWSRDHIDKNSPSMTELASVVAEILAKMSLTAECHDTIAACADMAPNLQFILNRCQSA